MAEEKENRFELKTIDCDSDHALSPNERVYKILDHKTGQLSMASYKDREWAANLVNKKNGEISTGA